MQLRSAARSTQQQQQQQQQNQQQKRRLKKEQRKHKQLTDNNTSSPAQNSTRACGLELLPLELWVAVASHITDPLNLQQFLRCCRLFLGLQHNVELQAAWLHCKYGPEALHRAIVAWLPPLVPATRFCAFSCRKDGAGYNDGQGCCCGLQQPVALVIRLLLFPTAAASLAHRNHSSLTPLMAASRRGCAQIVDLLLAEPAADMNATGAEHQTALHEAANHFCERTHILIVAALVKAGADVNILDQQQYSPLMKACGRRRSKTVMQLLAAPGVNVRLASEVKEGQTALHIACGNWDIETHLETMIAMLAAGADVNAGHAQCQCTPLHDACHFAKPEAVELLLAAPEILVNAVADSGVSDFQYPGDTRSYFTPLQMAAIGDRDDPCCTQLLLACADVEVNARDSHDNTALHLAATHGNAQIMAVLVACADVQVNARNQSERTPLHNACNLSASMCQMRPAWRTLLYFDEIMAALTAHPDLDINATDNLQLTPLHLAAYHGNREVVTQLLRITGINVNPVDILVRTPLHLAAACGHPVVVRQLLSHPDVIRAPLDGNLMTPLHLAQQGTELEHRVVEAVVKDQGAIALLWQQYLAGCELAGVIIGPEPPPSPSSSDSD